MKYVVKDKAVSTMEQTAFARLGNSLLRAFPRRPRWGGLLLRRHVGRKPQALRPQVGDGGQTGKEGTGIACPEVPEPILKRGKKENSVIEVRSC